MAIPDGVNATMLTDNCQGRQSYDFIAIHTSEGNSTAKGLASYCDRAGVSYNAIADDEFTVLLVRDNMAPWAAAGANGVALHICGAATFASWSRGKWLETDARDGLNESAMLDRMARWVASKAVAHNVPMEWVGSPKGMSWPPRRGICGHMDFGSRGGGHHDPGAGFPRDEFIKRVLRIAHPTPAPNLIDLAAKVAANWLGARKSKEIPIAGGAFAEFANAHIYWRSGDKVAHPIPHGGLFEAFQEYGFEKGRLGFPTRDHAVLKDGGVQAFQGGILYRKNGSAHGHYVLGEIAKAYAKDGYEAGRAGWPTSLEYGFTHGPVTGVAQDFDNGTYSWSAKAGVTFTGKA